MNVEIDEKHGSRFSGRAGANVPVERENSKARYTITDVRNRLSSQSVQARLGLKSWRHLLGLDPDVVQLDHD